MEGTTKTGIVTSNTSDARRSYCLPTPPAGSVVSFDLKTSSAFYLRLDNENGLELPTTELGYWGSSPSTYSVNVTIPSNATATLLGFLLPNVGTNVEITNWRVTAPAQSIFSDGLHLRGPNDSQPNQHYAAMAIGHKAMLLRRQPEDDPTWNQELRDEVGIVWNNLSKYEFTGLGGADTIAPVATTDPLPNPLPLPS